MFSRKQRSVAQHFSQYATNRPYVNLRRGISYIKHVRMYSPLDLEYPLELSMISGARYHRVATYSVKNPL